MKCKDIMRRPVQTLEMGATVQAAALKMKNANIGLIPICDQHGVVLGVLTDRDIAIRVVAPGLSPMTLCDTIATRDLVSCGPDDDLETVAGMMATSQTSRILVIDDDRLMGIVSLSDLAGANEALAAMALHEVAVREVLNVSGEAQPHGP